MQDIIQKIVDLLSKFLPEKEAPIAEEQAKTIKHEFVLNREQEDPDIATIYKSKKAHIEFIKFLKNAVGIAHNQYDNREVWYFSKLLLSTYLSEMMAYEESLKEENQE